LPAGMSFAEADCPLWEGGQHARPHGCTAPGYRKSPAGRRGGIPKCHNGVSAIAYKPTDSTPSCTVGCTACFGTGALACVRLNRLRPTPGVDQPPVVQRRTWEAPVSCRFRGLSLGCYSRASSAREHQQDDEAGGNNRDLQVQRQREVGGGTEEVEESAHPAIRPWRCCAAVRHLALVMA
jgi:hypothetical protein